MQVFPSLACSEAPRGCDVIALSRVLVGIGILSLFALKLEPTTLQQSSKPWYI